MLQTHSTLLWISITVLITAISFGSTMTLDGGDPRVDMVIDTNQWNEAKISELRNILFKDDNEQRYLMERSLRSLPSTYAYESGARGWIQPRIISPRYIRQEKTDKRQVRFRQCYFNPISCFRK